jgi:hypothetical protein
VIGYNSSGGVLFASGAVAFGINGVPILVDVELVANGSGGAEWEINTVQAISGGTQLGYSGTVSGVTVGYVSDWYTSPNGDVDFASAGWMSVQTYAVPIGDMLQVVIGYVGELAADRLARLCTEENLSFTLIGTDTDTPQMGPQQDDTFVNVVQSCEDMDRGQVFEPRDSFGLAYRTRVNMQGQSPVLTLDYSLGQLSAALQPVVDDEWTRNDLVITRNNGSSVTLTQQSGPMSILEPPNGCGDYQFTLTVYGFSDSQLANLTQWIMTVGTVADDRYPVLPVSLSRTEVAALLAVVANVDVGDYTQVINAPAWLTASPIAQLAWGFTETLNSFKWDIDVNAVPESPYSQGNPPSW